MKHEKFSREWCKNKITFTDSHYYMGKTLLVIDNSQECLSVYGWMKKGMDGTIYFIIPDKQSIQRMINDLEKLKQTAPYEEEYDIMYEKIQQSK